MKIQPLAMAALCLTAHPLGAAGQSTGGYDPAGEGLPLFRPSGAVPVLAVATSRWEVVPTDPHDLLGDYQFLPPYATEDTEGQLFVLLEAEAGQDVSDAEGRFVAVPWTVGCGCAEEGWDQPGWVPPGDTVAFLLTRTRERVRWKGPPVYDVLGWHQPYPTGDFIPYWPPGRVVATDWLTPREFYELLRALPWDTTFRLDPRISFEGVLDWVEQHPDRRDAFPLPTILQEWEKLLEGGAGRSPARPIP